MLQKLSNVCCLPSTKVGRRHVPTICWMIPIGGYSTTVWNYQIMAYIIYMHLFHINESKQLYTIIPGTKVAFQCQKSSERNQGCPSMNCEPRSSQPEAVETTSQWSRTASPLFLPESCWIGQRYTHTKTIVHLGITHNLHVWWSPSIHVLKYWFTNALQKYINSWICYLLFLQKEITSAFMYKSFYYDSQATLSYLHI